MRRIMAIVILTTLIAQVRSARAQGDDSGIGYFALIFTPPGGIAPVARQWMLSDPSTKISFDANWGHLPVDNSSINMFTGGVTFPTDSGKADFGLSAGYGMLNCSGCFGTFVLGAEYEGRVMQSSGTNGTFTLGLDGRLGLGRTSLSGGATTYLSASAGMPLSLAFGRGDAMRIVPFLTPAVGIGHVGSSLGETGVRLLVGGGVGILSQPSGIGATLGVQRVLIDGGKFLFGLGVSLIRR